MDIRDWSLDQIMQLPDCCFGRRWMVAGGSMCMAGSFISILCAGRLPERFVVWSVFCYVNGPIDKVYFFGFRLSDHAAVNEAGYNQQRLLFDTVSLAVAPDSYFRGGPGKNSGVLNLRYPVEGQSLGLLLGYYNSAEVLAMFQSGIVISSIPTEVPDWLVSGYRRSR